MGATHWLGLGSLSLVWLATAGGALEVRASEAENWRDRVPRENSTDLTRSRELDEPLESGRAKDFRSLHPSTTDFPLSLLDEAEIEPEEQTEQPTEDSSLDPETPAESCPVPPNLPPATDYEFTFPTLVNGNAIAIKVTGGTVFSGEEILLVLEKALEEFDNVETLSPEAFKDELLDKMVEAITLRYLEGGYFTSLAELNNNKETGTTTDIASGRAEIRIVEGRISEITVQGRNKLNLSYLCDRILLGISTPYNNDLLEDRARLLQRNPRLENLEGTLEESGEEGETRLKIVVDEANPIYSRLTVDNNSPPSVGSDRLGLHVGYRNLTGKGDEFSGTAFYSTTGGATSLDFSYQLPLNPMDGTLLLGFAPSWSRITQAPFDELDIRANRQQYRIAYRQPIVQSSREELALFAGFTLQQGQTFVFDLPTPFGIGPDADGVSRTSVFQLGFEYIRRSSASAWGVRSQFNFGTGLFGATSNSGSIPDSHFFSVLGQVQRIQRLNDNNTLIFKADLQWTQDSLLPAHQFVIGGSQSVRGFRQNARSGDNGFRFSIEHRTTLWCDENDNPILQTISFFDVGSVWNTPGNPNILPSQTLLIGRGAGLWFGMGGLSLRIDYSFPRSNLSDRGTNFQDDGLYFQLTYEP